MIIALTLERQMRAAVPEDQPGAAIGSAAILDGECPDARRLRRDLDDIPPSTDGQEPSQGDAASQSMMQIVRARAAEGAGARALCVSMSPPVDAPALPSMASDSSPVNRLTVTMPVGLRGSTPAFPLWPSKVETFRNVHGDLYRRWPAGAIPQRAQKRIPAARVGTSPMTRARRDIVPPTSTTNAPPSESSHEAQRVLEARIGSAANPAASNRQPTTC
jgi:hypothetical protein